MTVSQAIDEVLNDPARFMGSYWKSIADERRKELENLKLEEIQ